jgi:uncharacterized protein (TIGR03437 family)
MKERFHVIRIEASQTSFPMQNPLIFKLCRYLAVTAAIVLPPALFGYAEGPPPAHSGVPNEDTCRACHSGPGGSGSVVASGFASGMTYSPGAAQTITVTVSDPAQRRWGFQLTARVHGSPQTQAGAFTPGSDGFTQLSCGAAPFSGGSLANAAVGNGCATQSNAPLQYIEHTLQGTRLGQTGSAAFTFTWTPPSTNVGSIDIYLAGNAANGNSAPTGDNIYTTSYTVSPAAGAAPSISAGGIVNAAGFQQTIAPGSWVAITGSNLSATTRTWQAGDFTDNGTTEPPKLDDVTVSMGGLPAYVYYISPTQINVQAPALPPGPVSVQVTNSNGTSAAVTATVAAESPAFFLWNGKYAVTTRPDFTYVGPPGLFSSVATTPSKPGDTVILWGTGFGATTPAIPPGTLTPSTSATVNDPVSVTVGGLPAEYVGGAMTPGTAGLCQIVIKIPPSAPNGDLPVLASIDGVQSPAGVFITVQQ